MAAGADPAKVQLRIGGAQSMRVASDGAMEWSIGGQTFRDSAPLAWQMNGKRRLPVSVKYVTQQVDANTWRVGFAVGAYDKSQPLVIDPAWANAPGLVTGNSGDVVNATARDATNKVTWVCGTTMQSSLQRAFIAKFVDANTPGNSSSVFTYGGNGNDSCRGLALDADGYVYIAGSVESSDFVLAGAGTGKGLRASKLDPTKAPQDKDGFFAKINPSNGVMIWSSLFGGAGDDQANAVATDASGRLYLTGFTQPTCDAKSCTPAALGTSAATVDDIGKGKKAFVARVAADGQSFEYYHTLSSDGDSDIGHAITVDPSTDAVLLAGETNTTEKGIPTGVPGYYKTPNARPANADADTGDIADGFAARINPKGTDYEYFTLLTGLPNGTALKQDRAFGIKQLADGSALIVGETNSANFPTNVATLTNPPSPIGETDGFVVRLSSDGSTVLFKQYLGSTGYDSARSVVAVADGYYVLGQASGALGSLTGSGQVGGLSHTAFGNLDGFLARFVTASNALDFWGLIGDGGPNAFYALDADVVDVNAQRPQGRTVLYAGGVSSSSLSAAQQGQLLRIDSYGPPASIQLAESTSSPQSTVILQSFADLKVLVKDNLGQSVPRVLVRFTSPAATGASTNKPGAVNVTTDADGFATLTGLQANGFAGSYSVTVASGTATTSVALTNLKGEQTGFSVSASINPLAYGSTSTLVPAGGVSGAAVTYAFDDPAASTYCAITNAQVSVNKAGGSCKIVATNPGNANYNPITASITVSTIKGQQPAFAVVATPNSVVVGSTSALSFNGVLSSATSSATVDAASTSVCSINGTQVTALTAGVCIVNASNPGDESFNSATAAANLTVTKGSVGALTVHATPPAIVYGATSTLSTDANASTGVVSFAVTGPCTVAGNQLTSHGVGTCQVTASQAADANYDAATGSAPVTVTQANQAPFSISASSSNVQPGQSLTIVTSGGTTGLPVNLSITNGSPAICTLAGNVITAHAVGACTVQGFMLGNANYLATPASVITINAVNAPQAAITVSATQTTIAPGGTTTVLATGGSGTINYVYNLVSGGNACTLSPTSGVVTATAVGSCVINASNAASQGFDPATSSNSVTINVANKPQAQITVSALSTSIALNSTTTVKATGGSGTIDFSFALVSGAASCALDAKSGLVTGKAVGSCVINASNPASTGFDAATSANNVTINVGKAPQTIIFALPAGPMVLRAPDVALSATTDANGLTVDTFTSKTTRVCEVEGQTLKFYTAGTCTVTASQSGSTDFASAEKDASVLVNLPAGTASTVTGSIKEGAVTATISGDGWVFGPQNESGWEVTGFFPLSGEQPPANLEFPVGLFGFTAINGPRGTAVTITQTYPISFPANAEYWKYGKTSDNPTAHWYKLPGAVIAGNTVTFSVTDGNIGDHDMLANSAIVDPGGVAINKAAPPATSATPVPTLGSMAYGLIALMLAGAAVLVFRRQRG